MEPALKRTFVRFSIDRLKLLASRVEDCLGRLTEKQVWARSNENQNAIGNLVLHLCGNVRQWIISGIGGAPDVRRRDAEFAARATASRPELAAALTTTLGEALTVLESLPLTRLGERLIVQGREVTVLEGIYIVVEHFAGHTGQIIFATKLHAGQDLRQ